MRHVTKQLFIQFNPDGTEDLDVWRETFVNTGDPTEYAGAVELVGSWKNWLKFKKDWPVFANQILPEWLAELEIKLRSGAIRKMVGSMNDKLDTSAMRWLAEGKYKPAEAKKGTINKKQERLVKQGVMDEVEDIERVLQANVVRLGRT